MSLAEMGQQVRARRQREQLQFQLRGTLVALTRWHGVYRTATSVGLIVLTLAGGVLLPGALKYLPLLLYLGMFLASLLVPRFGVALLRALDAPFARASLRPFLRAGPGGSQVAWAAGRPLAEVVEEHLQHREAHGNRQMH